ERGQRNPNSLSPILNCYRDPNHWTLIIGNWKLDLCPSSCLRAFVVQRLSRAANTLWNQTARSRPSPTASEGKYSSLPGPDQKTLGMTICFESDVRSEP